jgi:hypothetical protein
MTKIIIKNYSSIKDDLVLMNIAKVLEQGKISDGKYGPQYCFMTKFQSGVVIYADRTKSGSHVFTVQEVNNG